MKKIFVTFFLLIFLIPQVTFWEYQDIDMEYYSESIEAFKNSPSADQIYLIENDEQRYCEQVYLEAYRRRDFTPEELDVCGQLFHIKMQQELDYMFYMENNRYRY